MRVNRPTHVKSREHCRRGINADRDSQHHFTTQGASPDGDGSARRASRGTGAATGLGAPLRAPSREASGTSCPVPPLGIALVFVPTNRRILTVFQIHNYAFLIKCVLHTSKSIQNTASRIWLANTRLMWRSRRCRKRRKLEAHA